MHAASVHPEPGSNSLKNGYLYPEPFRSRDKNTVFRVLSFLNALYFFELFQSVFRDSSHCNLVLPSSSDTNFCCSIFKDQSAAFLLATFHIIHDRKRFVKSFFLKNQKSNDSRFRRPWDMLFKTRFGSIAKSLLAVKGKHAKNRFFV